MAEPAGGPRPRLPPPDIAAIELPRVPATFSTWLRLHPAHLGALFFSKMGLSRWDHPDGIGAMCIGPDLPGIILERFGDELASYPFLSHTNVCDYRVTAVTIAPSDGVWLVDTCGVNALWHMRADAQLLSGSYEHSREWSLAFMRHPSAPSGVLYRSRHDPTRINLVLFDRPEVQRCLHAGESAILKDHSGFPGMLATLRLGVSPPPVPAQLRED